MKLGVRMCRWFATLALAAAAAAQTGDPLALVKRAQGSRTVSASGAIETVMLLAQLAAPGPPRNEFQARLRARYALHARHPAVLETADLLEHGWSYSELARFASLMTPAPYFVLSESEELDELAALLPATGDKSFPKDRLYGYVRLVKEFYWDNRVGRWLREAAPAYQQAVRRPLPEEVPAGARVLISLAAPVDRIEFTRRPPGPAANLVVLGSSELLPSAELERGSAPARTARKSTARSRPRRAPSGGSPPARN